MLTSTIDAKGKSHVSGSFYNVTQQCAQIQAALIALSYLGNTSHNLASDMTSVESTEDIN